MTFHVGQLVECVDAREEPEYLPLNRYGLDGLGGLMPNKVYRVRGFDPAYDHWVGCYHAVIWLEEIRRSNDYRGREPPFAAVRFRPLSEARIEVFRSLLVTPPVRDLEEVR